MQPETQYTDKISEILSKAGGDYVYVSDFVEQVGEIKDTLEQDRQNTSSAISELGEQISGITDGVESIISSQVDSVRSDIQAVDAKINTIALTPGPKGEQGVAGRDGTDGQTPVEGIDYVIPTAEEIASLVVVENGKDGKDGSPDTPDEVVAKINESKQLIKMDKIAGLSDLRTNIASAGGERITTSFINGVRAKNINFTGTTVSYNGDTAYVDVTGSSSNSSGISESLAIAYAVAL